MYTFTFRFNRIFFILDVRFTEFPETAWEVQEILFSQVQWAVSLSDIVS